MDNVNLKKKFVDLCELWKIGAFLNQLVKLNIEMNQ